MTENTQPGFPLSAISHLRFPYLFLIFGTLFVLDLFIPDLLPFADEIFLGLLTLMMGSFRRRKPEVAPEKPVEKNITPPSNR